MQTQLLQSYDSLTRNVLLYTAHALMLASVAAILVLIQGTHDMQTLTIAQLGHAWVNLPVGTWPCSITCNP